MDIQEIEDCHASQEAEHFYRPVLLGHSGVLFSRPKFFTGVGRLFDFGCTLNKYNYSLTPNQADELAILSDWLAVGDDMRSAIEIYEDELLPEQSGK